MTSLETARLILKPVELADAPQLQILFRHWEIVKYLVNIVPWPYPPDGMETFFGRLSCLGWNGGNAGIGR